VVFQVVHLSFTIKMGFWFWVFGFSSAAREVRNKISRKAAKGHKKAMSRRGQKGEKQSGKMQGRRDAAQIANRGIGVAVPLGCK
jgi:hypothetical protein